MATKIEPKKTATLGLEIWVRKPLQERIALAAAPLRFAVHVDRIGGMPEDLDGDPQIRNSAPAIFMATNSQ